MISQKRVYIANDHAGLKLKLYLTESFPHILWLDLGSFTEDSVNYVDFAKKVCEQVSKDADSFGVLICGSGQGMSMAANKYPQIRAALCCNTELARLARAHNKANVLCLGGRLLTEEEAKKIFKVFCETEFEGGRHEERVLKLSKIFHESNQGESSEL